MSAADLLLALYELVKVAFVGAPVRVLDPKTHDEQLARDVREYIQSARSTALASRCGAVSLCERGAADGGLSEP